MACGQLWGCNAAARRVDAPATTSSAFARGTPVLRHPVNLPPRSRVASFSVEARYRGVGTDRSQVAQFKRAKTDTGSPEVQIAQLSARVDQLTAHLKIHRKDYASTRGLMKVLSRRKSLMEYLKAHNRPKYEEVVATLRIRGLKEVIA